MPIRPQAPARDASDTPIDWAALKEAFIECRQTVAQFAEARGIDRTPVQNHCKRERWYAAREERHPEWRRDWDAIEALYVACDLTIPDFARAHDLSVRDVRNHAERGHWAGKRERDHTAGEGIDWAKLKTDFVITHGTVRRFARLKGLKYKTVLRHAKNERWELARLRHGLSIQNSRTREDRKMKARTEEEFDAMSEEFLSPLIDRLKESAPDLKDPRDMKIVHDAWAACVRDLRVTHGLPPEKRQQPGEFVELNVRQITRYGTDGKAHIRIIESGKTHVVDIRKLHPVGPDADSEAARIPGGSDPVPPAGGGDGQREDPDRR
jgi:hypothetical protein